MIFRLSGKCQELATCQNWLFCPSRYFQLEIRHFKVEVWEGKGNLARVALPPHVLHKILDSVPDRLTGLLNLLRLCGWTGTTNQGKAGLKLKKTYQPKIDFFITDIFWLICHGKT